MKRMIIAVVTFAMVALVSANAQSRSGRTRPDAHSKPSGGIVEKPYYGNYFRIINAQRAVTNDAIKEFVLKMRMETLLPFESRIGEPVDVESAKAIAEQLIKEDRVGAGIVIVDDAARNAHIESAEGRWAVLNISPLKADAPDAKKLETRCAKMLWRAAARALGVGYVAHDASVLKGFSTLAELDANFEMKPSPDGSNAMLQNASSYGITPLTIASYRTACHNGWAPQPTNDVQRIIWEQVNGDKERGPSNPRPIKFKGPRPPRP